MAMASASMRRLQSPLVQPRPTPPPSESIAAAIRRLRAIGAIEDDGPWLRDLPISFGSHCTKGSEQEGHQRHGEGNWEVTDTLRLRSIGHVDLVELRKQHRRPG